MKSICANCGAALLESDTTCYRCQAAVPGRELGGRSTEEPKIDLKAVATFAAVVLSLVLLGAVVTSWMGAGLSSAPDTADRRTAPAGWSEYTSPLGDFEIWLPDTWRRYTRSNPEWQALVEHLIRPLPNGFERGGKREREARLSMIAQSSSDDSTSTLTLSVELYPELAHISLETLQNYDWWAAGERVDTAGGLYLTRRQSGEQVLVADLFYPSTEGSYVQSVTNLIITERGAYVISISGTVVELLPTEELLWNILDSFRLLNSSRP